jgi:hypothetical protein
MRAEPIVITLHLSPSFRLSRPSGIQLDKFGHFAVQVIGNVQVYVLLTVPLPKSAHAALAIIEDFVITIQARLAYGVAVFAENNGYCRCGEMADAQDLKLPPERFHGFAWPCKKVD